MRPCTSTPLTTRADRESSFPRSRQMSWSTSVEVKLDKTAPSIDGAHVEEPNENGWYRGPVTVHFECTDALSGVVDCTPDVKLADDGADQSVHGTALDRAGNGSSDVVNGINIDSVAPTTSTDVP